MGGCYCTIQDDRDGFLYGCSNRTQDGKGREGAESMTAFEMVLQAENADVDLEKNKSDGCGDYEHHLRHRADTRKYGGTFRKQEKP